MAKKVPKYDQDCRGLTQATFALLGKMLYLKLLFIAIDKGVLKGSGAILIKAGGILSFKSLLIVPPPPTPTHTPY